MLRYTYIACLVNAEYVSRYGRLYDAGRRHGAVTRHKTTNHGVFFELLAEADSEACHSTFHEFCTVFPVFEWPL